MDTKANGFQPARRRAVTAAVCSVVVAVVGGALIATPAYASAMATSASCATTQPVTVNGASLSDVATKALSITPVTCGTTPTPTTSEPTAVATPTTVGSSSTAVPADAKAPTPTESATADSKASTQLSNVMVNSSTQSVYPVRDGYLDDVRFEIRALGSSGQLVPVQGTAIMSKAGKVAQSWTLDTSTSVLSWDGRIGGKIRRGVYTLTVTLYSPDGSTKTTERRVRVLTKHVERRAITVRSKVSTNDSRATLPPQVLKAYGMGPVTVAVRTVAKVTGPAKLLFSNDGIVRTVPLRNGVHTGTRGVVPAGFESVTITHKWAKGAAKLKSIEAIWTYYTLVK